MTPPLSPTSGSDRDNRPPLDARASSPVDQLGEAIAELAARLHAATYELLVLLREFDEGAAGTTGSCRALTGCTGGPGSTSARRARRCAWPRRCPATAAQRRAAARRDLLRQGAGAHPVATPENEPQLLDVALTATAAQVERVARAWRRCDRDGGARTPTRGISAASVTHLGRRRRDAGPAGAPDAGAGCGGAARRSRRPPTSSTGVAGRRAAGWLAEEITPAPATGRRARGCWPRRPSPRISMRGVAGGPLPGGAARGRRPRRPRTPRRLMSIGRRAGGSDSAIHVSAEPSMQRAAPRRPETQIGFGAGQEVGYVSGALSPARNLTGALRGTP